MLLNIDVSRASGRFRGLIIVCLFDVLFVYYFCGLGLFELEVLLLCLFMLCRL